MKAKKNNSPQTYNDGMCHICSVGDVSEPGCMPKEGLVEKYKLAFADRTVGINRYYAALQNNIKAERLIRCQRIENVTVQDVVLIKDKQYFVRQIQYPAEVMPRSMDLTLERVVQHYE